MMPIFERELMMSGLVKQRNILNRLISELGQRREMSDYDCRLYQEITAQVEKNLNRLRQIRRDGCVCEKPSAEVN